MRSWPPWTISSTIPMPSDSNKTDAMAVPRVGQTVREALDHYFRTLGDQSPHALYDMVISATEKPLLEFVMARYNGNVSHAAKALGITRNTLRKKLELYGLYGVTKN